MLLLAGILLLLFVANFRSRIYFHGPDYGFLLWMCIYCAILAIGLLRLRKWVLVLFFVPAVLVAAALVHKYRDLWDNYPAILFAIVVLWLLAGLAANALRYLHELSWRL